MLRRSRLPVLALTVFALVPVHAATVSRQHADSFLRKLTLIQRQGDATDGAGPRRTALTQDEVNSWFAYAATPLLPAGLADPQLTIVGDGRLAGQAVVDLDVVAKRRSSGGRLDPWSFVGGKVPVTVTGVLHTRDGVGRFELQSAEISGVAIPTTLVQDLVSYYSRTPDRPQGVKLDDAFPLPANIRQIEVGQGQAVVVQ